MATAGHLCAQAPPVSAQHPQTIYSPLAQEQLQAAPTPDQMRLPVTLSLQTALERTLACNPDLVAVRQNLRVSAEAVQVAKLLPTDLNPTLSVDVRPWVFGATPGGGTDRLLPYVSVNWNQPIELGSRTAKRTMIAHAEYDVTHWNIVQAELLALVQTYRAYQTAVYRRDKLEVARELAELNSHLLQVLQRQLEANQAPAADVVLANVENLSAQQRVEAAQQEYVDALAELRQQIGIVELADTAEPEGRLEAPQDTTAGDDEGMVQTALCSRPEIQTARAQVERSRVAVCLARADRIPIPSVGPVYEKDESGSSFYGMTVTSPIPIWNANGRLVNQREAEYHRDLVALEQTQQRVIVQVKTSAARWTQAQQLAARTTALMRPLQDHEARMERLFTAGQTDLVKLLQVRQRWLDGANTQLDATWQATQAYADLLASLGGTPLLALLPVRADR
jgi:cobalt-zinc-cadmium efflux system outer membrane protein